LVECFINKIKHYRRVFSRFEKLSKNYLGSWVLSAPLFGSEDMSTEPSISLEELATLLKSYKQKWCFAFSTAGS
jgi:hypothetical protein